MRTPLLLAVLLACASPSSQRVSTASERAAAPGQGQPCPQGACAPGLRCVRYFGIAGPKGPSFSSCEIPCLAQDACPDGQRCVTIADGPGRVCRSAR